MSWIAVGIGAAVGATGGAIIGSKKGGDDVWKGALMGGVLGAAGGGIGGAAFGGAGAAAEGAVGAGAGEAALGAGAAEGAAGSAFGSALPQGAISSGQLAGGAAGSSAFDGMAAPASSLMGTQGFGGGAAALSSAYGTPVSVGAAGAAPASGGVMSGLSNFAANNKGLLTTAGTLGLGALLAQDNKKYGVPKEEPYSGPLSKFHYNPSNYTPNYATPNVYKASYADGGIAQLASPNPQMMQTGPANVDYMGGDMFPQSQMEHNYYNTPHQMPTSAQQVMASYEPKTNPLTGEPTVNMAEGGSTSGNFDRPLPNPEGYMLEMSSGKWVPSNNGGDSSDLPLMLKAFQGQDASNQTDEEETNAYLKELFANKTMADGGIASLGGYSDGGQLLKGPGDGVSDDIPASIAGKQPARLANNEFVLPARIVSEIGEGSTDAGAKKLYQMMDRVQARRGKSMGKGKFAAKSNAAKELDKL